MANIKFSREMNFTGRNGYFKASGIDLLPLDYDKKIIITPLTSKGRLASCDITIPKEDIPELINQLKKLIV